MGAWFPLGSQTTARMVTCLSTEHVLRGLDGNYESAPLYICGPQSVGLCITNVN